MAFSIRSAIPLALAAIMIASPLLGPLHGLSRRENEADPALCENAVLDSPEGTAAVWNDNSIGTYLDDYLGANGEDNWLNNLTGDAFPGSGDRGSYGCKERDQPCMTQMQGSDICAFMAGRGRGSEYWIFNAVQKMQDSFERAHENLQDSVIDSSLTVSAINSDFKVELKTSEQILRYVAAAFGIAGGLVGYGTGPLVNGLKTTANMFGGAFAASANQVPVAIDSSKVMDATLKEIFAAQRTILDGTLELAVGGGGDYASLPDQAGDYSTSVAKFMADGKFLLQGDLVSDYFSTGYDVLNKKLVDIALQQFGYHVPADHNYEDAESCAGQNGAFWMDILGGRCMGLVYKQGSDNVYWPASEDAISAAEDKYSINLQEYYQAACDCAMNGSGEPDTEALPGDGSLPQCFYNINCQDAEVCEELNGDWSICWPIDINEVASWS